jgi:hypothetical protein
MADEEKSEEGLPRQPEWQHKTNFGVTEQMRKIIGLTIEASQSEIASLRRKLKKLTYGS